MVEWDPESKFPDWFRVYFQHAFEVLGFPNDTTIWVGVQKIEPAPDEPKHLKKPLGSCVVDPVYPSACINFSSEIVQGDEYQGRLCMVHELLHVKQGPLAQLCYQTIRLQREERLRQILFEQLRTVEEACVMSLDRMLVALIGDPDAEEEPAG